MGILAAVQIGDFLQTHGWLKDIYITKNFIQALSMNASSEDLPQVYLSWVTSATVAIYMNLESSLVSLVNFIDFLSLLNFLYFLVLGVSLLSLEGNVSIQRKQLHNTSCEIFGHSNEKRD